MTKTSLKSYSLDSRIHVKQLRNNKWKKVQASEGQLEVVAHTKEKSG